MKVLFTRIVLAVAVPTSLSRIMLGTRALVCVADYVLVMRRGFHSASWKNVGMRQEAAGCAAPQH